MVSTLTSKSVLRSRPQLSLLLAATAAVCVLETWTPASSAAAIPPNARRSATLPPTALDLYVAAPDTNFAWKVISTAKGSNYTASVLQLTSQAWLTTNEVPRSRTIAC